MSHNIFELLYNKAMKILWQITCDQKTIKINT